MYTSFAPASKPMLLHDNVSNATDLSDACDTNESAMARIVFPLICDIFAHCSCLIPPTCYVKPRLDACNSDVIHAANKASCECGCISPCSCTASFATGSLNDVQFGKCAGLRTITQLSEGVHTSTYSEVDTKHSSDIYRHTCFNTRRLR